MSVNLYVKKMLIISENVSNLLKYLLVFKGGILMLNEYEKNRYNVISDLVSKKITIREAVQLLNITERQVYRLKKIFKEQGEKGFIHGNCGKENPNKK